MIGLKELRKAAGIRQNELAQALGRTPRNVRQWENGERGLPMGMVFPLARILGVTVQRVMEAVAEDEAIGADRITA